MIEKYLNNRFLILYLSIYYRSHNNLSFQPFNLTIINFIILPLFFYLIVYINKKSKAVYRKKPIKKIFYIWIIIWFWFLFKRRILDC